MFDFVRKHTKVMMFLMFLLIIPAFVLVGVDGFKSINASGDTVAKVGGQSITQAEWDATHKNEVDRLRASMPTLDAKLLDSPEARYIALERLVRERVLIETARTSHLNTSDARLARELQQDATIQSLRKPDGTFDMERYRQLAGAQGMTPEGLEAQIRRDVSMRQVEAGIITTAFAPAALVDTALNAFFERREVQIARFTTSSFAAKANPSDAEIEAYYQAHQDEFQAQELANIEYVVLDLDAVKKSITISDAELKTYYTDNATRLSGKEERRASHILISANKDTPAAERQKAKERAQALLAQVRKAPESFAEVARKNSQDTGSAAKGGDLDFFGRGAMVKPFEESAFALKKGEISDLVESDFGFHIIRVTDIKAPKQRSFDELRASMEADLKAKQAQRKFAEVAETFTNGVYEQSDSLKPVADRLKLELKTATGVQRTAQPGITGVLVNPKFLAAVFSADSVEKKRNTEAVEIGTNQMVAARITQYTPARTLPLVEVRTNVREVLIAQQAAALAVKEGTAKLAAWKAANAASDLPAAVTLSRDQKQPIRGALLDAAMSADATALPVWVGVDLGTQGYAVMRVNKVLARVVPTEVEAKQERVQYTQWMAGAENLAYYELLKDRLKVQMKVQRPVSPVFGSAAAK